MSIPITREQAVQASKAVRRLTELRNMAQHTANEDSEQLGLVKFLDTFFADHQGEFLACWFAVRDEYEPMIGMFSILQLRTQNFNAMRAREAADAAPIFKDKEVSAK